MGPWLACLPTATAVGIAWLGQQHSQQHWQRHSSSCSKAGHGDAGTSCTAVGLMYRYVMVLCLTLPCLIMPCISPDA